MELRFDELVPCQGKYLSVKIIHGCRDEKHRTDHPSEIGLSLTCHFFCYRKRFCKDIGFLQKRWCTWENIIKKSSPESFFRGLAGKTVLGHVV